MTKTDLLERIGNGENSQVEFKRDTIDNRALAKEIVAFLNLRGGCVLLGVDDDASVVGLSRRDGDARDRTYAGLEQWVMQTGRDKIRPEVIPSFQVIRDVEPGLDVAVVEVDAGWSVHHVWHDKHYIPYIRVGSLSREMSPDARERIYQQRGSVRVELRPVTGTSLEDFDVPRLERYFGTIRHQTPPPGTNEDWERLLTNTELMIEEDSGIRATVAGLLLFGRTPNRYLPQAGVDVAAYPGVEKDYAASGRDSLRGPMVPLLAETSGEVTDAGLVERALEFVNRHAGVSATIEAGRRVDRRTYPEDVVREVIVNALVHRDYSLSATNIEISLYRDRLEVISPGRLPNGITPERMRAGARAARNQLLKDVMRDYRYMEHMAMGVSRKVVRGMWAHNQTEPDLLEGEESFTVRLWAGPQGAAGN